MGVGSGYVHQMRGRIPFLADPFTRDRLSQGVGYCRETLPGGNYPPIVEPRLIRNLNEPIAVDGPGGRIEIFAYRQIHGDIDSLGFRIGDVAYSSDVSD